MPRLYETQPAALQLALAVHARRPAGLAQTFASYAGQFYDRGAFDALARQVNDLYAATSPDDAHTFRSRLDRRLCDRHHTPVTWGADVGADADRPVATGRLERRAA